MVMYIAVSSVKAKETWISNETAKDVANTER